MRVPILFLAAVCAGISLGGCAPEAVACAEYAALALQVDVTDLDGVPLPGASVSFRVDGGEWQEATSCLDGSTDPEDCTSFATAWEVPGTYEVLVEYDAPTGDPCCWHTGSATETVTVEADECHVIPEQVTVAVSSSEVECTDACV